MKYHFLHGRQQQLFKLFPNPFTLLALQCLQWCTVNHLVLYFTWSQIRANNGRGYFPSHIVVSNFLRTFFLFFFSLLVSLFRLFMFFLALQVVYLYRCSFYASQKFSILQFHICIALASLNDLTLFIVLIIADQRIDCSYTDT